MKWIGRLRKMSLWVTKSWLIMCVLIAGDTQMFRSFALIAEAGESLTQCRSNPDDYLIRASTPGYLQGHRTWISGDEFSVWEFIYSSTSQIRWIWITAFIDLRRPSNLNADRRTCYTHRNSTSWSAHSFHSPIPNTRLFEGCTLI